MRHLDLFAGIGGFSFAADRVWPGIQHTFVEYDPFPQAVLRKHWPDAAIHGDIRAFVADAARQRRQGERIPARQGSPREGAANPDRYDLITGGFPCQPFSAAGRRKGTEDDRYLWPPMLEAIALFEPRWIMAENVRGLTSWNNGMVLETVCSDLEALGYEVQPLIIPAASVGAPHKRERVWIIAHRDRAAVREQSGRRSGAYRKGPAQHSGSDKYAPDAASGRREEGNTQRRGARKGACAEEERDGLANGGRVQWKEDWPSAATRLCTVDDGLPGGLVRPDGGRDAEKEKHSGNTRLRARGCGNGGGSGRPRGWRKAALEAAGNAIVPQVAEMIMRRMAASGV